MANPLQINITANLDKQKTISNINSQIVDLSKNLKSLNVQVNIDGSQFSQLKKQIAEIQNQLKNSKLSSPINVNQAKQDLQQIESVARTTVANIKRDLQAANPNSTIKLSTLFDTNGADKQIKNVTATIDDLQGHIQKIKYELDSMNSTKVVNGDFGLKAVSSTAVDNTQNIQNAINKAKNNIVNNLAEISRQGKLSVEQISQLLNSVSGAKSVDELNKIKQSMSGMITQARQQSDALKSQQQLWDRLAQSQRNSAEESAKWERDQQAAIDKTKQETAALDQQLATYKRLAQVNVTNLMTRNMNNPNAIDHSAVDQYLKSVQNLTSETPNLKNKMQDLSTSFKEIQANAGAAGGRMMTFGGSMQRSISGIALWTASGGLVYGLIHGFQDMIKTIVDVDTKMTELKRVMSSNTDFNGMLQQTIKLSSQLGRTLSDLLDSEASFATAGNFSEKQILQLTKVSALMQNISDLNAADATNALIAGMTNFNISASNSLKIVNSLNNVDNHFAATTQVLAQAMTRAGATAKTYGVNLDELNGLVVAISESTREKGSQIGNSIRSILSEFSSPKAITALQSIGVEVKNANGQLRSGWDIIKETASRYKSLSSEQRNFVSLSVSGRQRLTEWNALMANFGDAQSAATVSAHSANSAMQEQERYANSYQARINQLTTSWQAFQLQMGKSFVDSGLSTGIAVALQFTKAMGGVISRVGALPIAIISVTAALLAFNRGFRQAAIQGTLLQGVTKGLTASMSMLDAVINTVKTSWRGLLASTIIGAAFVGISIAVEKAISAISDYNAQQAKAQKQLNSQSKSYRDHGNEIDNLVTKYKKLSAQVANGTISPNDKNYLDTQNKLNKLLPSLTDYVGKNGQAHLRSAEAIDSELKGLRQLNDQKQVTFVKTFSDQLDTLNKKIKQSSADIVTYRNAANTAYQPKGLNAGGGSLNNNPSAQAKQQLQSVTQQIASEEEYQNQLKQRVSLFKQFASSYANVIGASKRLTSSDQQYIQSLVDQNKKETDTKSGQAKLQKQIEDTTSVFDKFRQIFGKKIPTQDLQNIASALDGIHVKASKTDDVQKLSKQFLDGDINARQLSSGLKSLGVNSEDTAGLVNILTKAQLDQSNASKKQASILIDVVSALKDASQYADLLSTVLSGSKVSDDLPGQMQRAINGYKILTDTAKEAGGATKMNAQQQQFLSQTYQTLAAQFPQFVQGNKLNVKAIQQQIDADKAVQQAEVDASNGTITAERASFLAKAEYAKKRIDTIQAEIAALNIYQKAYDDFVAHMSDNYNSMSAEDQVMQTKVAQRMEVTAKAFGNSDALKQSKQYKQLIADLGTESKKYTAAAGGLTSTTDKSTSSTDKATQSVTRYKYVADTLGNSLNKVNAEYQTLNDKVQQYDTASSKYRSAMSQEISLLKQKATLLKEQEASLEQQIKSGNIIQYGVQSSTTDTASGGSSSSVSSSSVSGGSTTKSWTNAIKAAAQQMGVKLTQAGLNSVLEQIKTESGGSETVTNMWDSNAKAGHPSTGLLQYIQSTFNKYKVSGHGNIHSGYDQLLALFNDKNWYQDIAGSGGWGPSGGRRTSGGVSAVSGSSSSSKSSSTTIGQAKAEQQQAVAQAKQQLLDLKQQIIDNENAIQAAYMNIVTSHITAYDNRLKSLDTSITKYQAKAESADQASKIYRSDISKEISLTKDKAKVEQQEADYIKSQYTNNKKLSAAQRADLKSQYQDKIQSLNDTKATIQELNLEIVNSQVASYENQGKAIDNVIAKYQMQASIADQTSRAYVDALREQESETIKKQALEQKEIDYINQQIKSNKNLTSAQKAQLKDQVLQLQSTLYSTEQSISDINNQIKQVYQNLSDSITQAYKDMYQSELDAAQKAHDKKVQLLDDEAQAFQNSIQKQQDAIDQQANQDSYAEELAKDQKAVADLQKQINNFSLDTSLEGKSKVSDLTQQLQDAQQTLDDFQKQHSTDMRKQALQDAQDAYTTNNDAQKKAADDALTAYQDQINNIVNDNQKWTNMQQDILNGHYGNILKDFQNFSNVFQQESDLLGQSITNNLLNKMKDLSDQINGLGLSGNGTNTWGYSTPGVKLPQFADGGDTGDWSGNSGMLAILHKKEIIMNESQQNALKNYISNLGKNTMSIINGITSQFAQVPQVATVTNNQTNTNNTPPVTFTNCDFSGLTKTQVTDAFTEAWNAFKSKGGR